MNTLKVKVKKLHPNAVIPRYAKPGDAGLDLVATEATLMTRNQIKITVSDNDTKDANITVCNRVLYKFGLAFEIPEGYVGLIFPRSSIYKTSLALSNCVGVIDSGYRGEVSAVFNVIDIDQPGYKVGDRCAQMIIMPYPSVELVEADELSSTERGAGGFGSTGA